MRARVPGCLVRCLRVRPAPVRRPFLVLGAFLLAALPGAAREAPAAREGTFRPATLVPPLDGARVLTSSFGEFRAGHYHGGIDLSTGGREGEPVRAPAEGWVWRVRASGVGYGKAIYYRLEDGRTAVFAHLSAFHPRLDSLVVAEQDRERRYEVDLRPRRGAFRFRAGEVIAWSGGSGAGPPHLHAELRAGDDASIAQNPLTHGWSVADTVSPSLTRVRLEPAAAGALVNGGVDPVILDLQGVGPRAVSLTGPVSLWLETADRTTAEANRVAPFRGRVRVDGRVVAEIGFEAVDWNWPAEVRWTFRHAAARRRDERWLRVDPPPDARQEIARWVGDARSLTGDVAAGPHRWRFEVEDVAGNLTARELVFSVMDRDPGALTRAPAPVEAGLESRGAFLHGVVASTAAARARPASWDPGGREADPGWLEISTPGGTVVQLGEPDPGDAGCWQFQVPGPGGRAVEADAVWLPVGWNPFAGPTVVAREGRYRLSFARGATYGPLWITLREDAETRDERAAAGPELERVTPILRMGPWAHPFRTPARAELFPPAGAPRRGLGLYRWDDEWSFVDADTSGKGVAGEIGSPEHLALFRDRTPPAIVLVAPAAGKLSRLDAKIADRGAGVSWRTMAMTLDGDPVVAEWDPEAGRLAARVRRALEPGRHRWDVVAWDRVGNRAERSMEIVVP